MTLSVVDCGRVSHNEMADIQKRVHAQRVAGEVSDTLLLAEHDPVFTKGRGLSSNDPPLGPAHQGIPVEHSDRGGHATYLGPGMLIGVPIFRVRNVREYIAKLEQALIDALGTVGVHAERREGHPGVWVGDKAIATIALYIAQGVARQGFALHVDGDLKPFEAINPCGIGAQVTSIAQETGQPVDHAAVRAQVVASFLKVFGLTAEFPQNL